ncbi:hypothetical protein [Streptomyces sp. 2132.2]|nr:hypothetical protein [Streptomyces sp. 2132.2]
MTALEERWTTSGIGRVRRDPATPASGPGSTRRPAPRTARPVRRAWASPS